MRSMKKWRAVRKALAFGLKMAVLITITSGTLLPGMIARCRTLAEGLILLGVLCGMAVCAGVTGWLAVEYDNETNRQWREYRRMVSRVRGCK